MKLFRIVLINIVVLCLAILTEASGTPADRSFLAPDEAGKARPAPKVVTPYTSFNFGDVYTGEVISQLFVVKNVGDADLQITEFKGDCGCTVVHAEKVIAPGHETVVEIEVQTVSQSGIINKMATMRTNDPDQPAILFSLVANVLKGAPLRQGKYIGPIFLSPDSRGSMFSMPGKKTTSEFSITSEQAQLKVLRVEVGTRNFTARVVEVEPGRSYKIQVDNLPIEKGGMYTDQITVVTDHPALPPFKIDLSLRVYEVQ
ncbi:MAG TPA: DUF1573 domain-containing protein [Blastocatellia bacterium]|nr:DUF1573 domain-containing protein [Blastocatellia bacterium]